MINSHLKTNNTPGDDVINSPGDASAGLGSYETLRVGGAYEGCTSASPQRSFNHVNTDLSRVGPPSTLERSRSIRQREVAPEGKLREQQSTVDQGDEWKTSGEREMDSNPSHRGGGGGGDKKHLQRDTPAVPGTGGGEDKVCEDCLDIRRHIAKSKRPEGGQISTENRSRGENIRQDCYVELSPPGGDHPGEKYHSASPSGSPRALGANPAKRLVCLMGNCDSAPTTTSSTGSRGASPQTHTTTHKCVGDMNTQAQPPQTCNHAGSIAPDRASHPSIASAPSPAPTGFKPIVTNEGTQL